MLLSILLGTSFLLFISRELILNWVPPSSSSSRGNSSVLYWVPPSSSSSRGNLSILYWVPPSSSSSRGNLLFLYWVPPSSSSRGNLSILLEGFPVCTLLGTFLSLSQGNLQILFLIFKETYKPIYVVPSSSRGNWSYSSSQGNSFTWYLLPLPSLKESYYSSGRNSLGFHRSPSQCKYLARTYEN